MSWATVADMLDRFNREDNPELDQITAAPGDPADEAIIQASLDESEAMIGCYLGDRVLTAADDDNLRRIQCDLARWTLYRDSVPERVQQIYLADIDQLRAISKRELSLPSEPTGAREASMTTTASALFAARGF
jgi:phage gp36-like protein